MAYAESESVAMTVGFYYMANAAGRLLGTVLSGALFQAGGSALPGLLTCLLAALGLTLLSAVLAWPLARAGRRSTSPAASLPALH